jgi:hypothetical protein
LLLLRSSLNLPFIRLVGLPTIFEKLDRVGLCLTDHLSQHLLDLFFLNLCELQNPLDAFSSVLYVVDLMADLALGLALVRLLEMLIKLVSHDVECAIAGKLAAQVIKLLALQ